MNPEQYPAPVPSGNNPYQFIVAPEKPPRRGLPGLGPLKGGSFITKLVFIVGGAVLLMIVLAVVVNIFFSSGGSQEALVKLTQDQTELLRIGEQASKLDGQVAKNAAANTNNAIESQHQRWLTYLADNGREVGEKEQALTKDATLDQKLTNADENDTFDATFSEIAEDLLKAYAADLQTAYNSNSKETLRTALTQDFDSVQLLLKQWAIQ